MSKHTPGPWEVSHGGHGRRNGFVIDEYYVLNRGVSDDVAIAAEIIDPVTQMPSEANARLIAAAPELLACQTMGVEMNVPDFLDWIADRLEYVHGENRLMDYMHHLRNIAQSGRAAIAKATGQ